MSKTWFNIAVNEAEDSAEVMIYDQIGQHFDWETGKKVGLSDIDFISQFEAIDKKTINIRINSDGGDVYQGFAIANSIRNHPSTVNVRVDSLAASISAVIAMSGDTVCIEKNAYLMIHDPLCMCMGNSEDLRANATQLDQLANTIGQTFADKSGRTLEDVRAKMRDETWFDSKSAKEFGLVDSIAGDDDDDEDDDTQMLNSATAMRAIAKYKKAPQRFRKYAASLSAIKPPLETPMPEKIIVRDGKHFVNIAGKDIEVDVTPMNIAGLSAKIEPPIDVEAIKKAAADKAVADERTYRSMFNTVTASAGLTGKDAEKFETDFYGRAETDLKFLASHAIGTRAKPVGEGSGGPEGKEVDEIGKVGEAAGKRFDDEPAVRSMYGNNLRDKDSDSYKSARGRHVAAARRSAEPRQ